MGRLPIAKMLAATVGLTVVMSAVMLSINWDGQQGSTAAPKIDTGRLTSSAEQAETYRAPTRAPTLHAPWNEDRIDRP